MNTCKQNELLEHGWSQEQCADQCCVPDKSSGEERKIFCFSWKVGHTLTGENEGIGHSVQEATSSTDMEDVRAG